MGICMAIALAAGLQLRYNLLAPSALPSVCSGTTTGDIGWDLLILESSNQLPGGIGVSITDESDPARNQVTTVFYRERKYRVEMRRNRRGACFAFDPPLPLERSKHTIKADFGIIRVRVSYFLVEKWPYALGLAVLLAWFVYLFKSDVRRPPDITEPAQADKDR